MAGVWCPRQVHMMSRQVLPSLVARRSLSRPPRAATPSIWDSPLGPNFSDNSTASFVPSRGCPKVQQVAPCAFYYVNGVCVAMLCRIVPKQPFEGACARLAASGRSPHWSFVCRWSLGDESSNSFSALRLQGTAVVAVVRCSRNPELLQVACADVTPPRGFGAALWVHEHVHRSEARNRKCAILLKGSWERVRVCDVNPTQSGANVSHAPQPHCVALVELRAVRAVC